MALDILWYLMAIYAWSSGTTHDQYVWDSLGGLHTMSLFVSFVNIGLRVEAKTWILR